MYFLRKSFKFKKTRQAETFQEIAHVYGRVRLMGTEVLFEARLDFTLWRKLNYFAVLLRKKLSKVDSIYILTKEAGLKEFKEL